MEFIPDDNKPKKPQWLNEANPAQFEFINFKAGKPPFQEKSLAPIGKVVNQLLYTLDRTQRIKTYNPLIRAS